MEPGKNGVKNNQTDMNDGARTSKFLYKASTQKSDPWSKNDDEFDDIIKPDMFTTDKKRNSSSPGVDLDDVWSIRKNVQVTASIKNGSALKTTGKSFYSRHGGLSGNVDANTSVMSKKQRMDGEEMSQSQSSSGWSAPRPGYSYSDKFSFDNNGSSQSRSPLAREFGDIIADDNKRRHEEEDFESKKNRLNARLPMPGAPQIAAREMSARTKRAQTLQQAHMKSRGLGQYSSPSAPYTKQLDDDD
ncbi:uncharacterized protein LOC116292636 [Actinia tenebrosa]|uniref:Uncharacterized protein LOC116292636 n=1 Tax=Actinia tenebrosa TaxID=6105 RepID=A0A6P8HT41_ACTTE|nr:uncharacterized protein LOC116292636 [Actinia tenebrosa]